MTKPEVEPADETTALEMAVKYLSARYVPYASEWVYYADESRRHYVVDADELEDLGARLDAGSPEAYSEWCADTTSRELPAGWTFGDEIPEVGL